MYMLRRFIKQTNWTWQLLRTAVLASPQRTPRAVWRNSARAADLCKRYRFTAEEVHRYGLLHPADGGSPAVPIISRSGLTKLQKALNPESLVPMLRNKIIFYRHCMASGLPTPQCFAFFLSGQAGFSLTGQKLSSPEQWESFISEELPSRFVGKPAVGARGAGVCLFERHSNGFSEARGSLLSARQLYDWLVAGAGEGGGGMIIQQRLDSHPDIIRLTGTEYLQTVRIITLLDGPESTVRILHSHLKLVMEGRVLDGGDRHNETSSQRVLVDVASGGLVEGLQKPGTTPGFVVLRRHPRTGLAFSDFSLPFWDQACELVRAAARQFWPMRTVGWDVAFTPDRVVITEGNARWDPPVGFSTIPSLVAAVAEGAGRSNELVAYSSMVKQA